MRWVLSIIALATVAWYISDRQRRARLQQSMEKAVPPSAAGQAQSVARTMGAAARRATDAVQTRLSVPVVHAPSAPVTDATPTTGMEQPPQIDHTAAFERTSGAYVGNTKTRVFHRADSPHLPAEENRVYFSSAEEARAAAFEPAQNEGLETTDQ